MSSHIGLMLFTNGRLGAAEIKISRMAAEEKYMDAGNRDRRSHNPFPVPGKLGGPRIWPEWSRAGVAASTMFSRSAAYFFRTDNDQAGKYVW